MSEDSEQEFFADGISEDIITDLSKITENMKGKKYTAKTNLKGPLSLGGHASGVYYRNMYAAELEKTE